MQAEIDKVIYWEENEISDQQIVSLFDCGLTSYWRAFHSYGVRQP